MAPSSAHLEGVERVLIATYRYLLLLDTENLEASLRHPQNGKRLYQLFCKAERPGDRQLIPVFDIALRAPPDTVSIANAKLVKAQE